MSRVQPLLFAVALVLLEFNLVQSGGICDFNNEACVTKVGDNIFKAVMRRVKGLNKPNNPLIIEKIRGDVELETFQYDLTNVKLTGLQNCRVKSLKYFPGRQLTYEYYLQCPHLVYDFHYEAKGTLTENALDGIGEASVTINDCLIIIKGSSEKITSKKDQKIRLVLKEYNIETDVRGKIIIVFKNRVKADKAKIDFVTAYVNNDMKEFENHLRTHLLEKSLEPFMKNLKLYLEAYPVEQLFSKHQ